MSSKDIYIANKYASNPPSDYLSGRIPPLKILKDDGSTFQASANSNKSDALSSTFFPPPPPIPMIPSTAYPEPFRVQGYFTHDNIHSAICKLKPYKAPGADSIQNIVLQQCIESIIHHLYYIFWAILELDSFLMRWLTLLTIILCKPAKPSVRLKALIKGTSES